MLRWRFASLGRRMAGSSACVWAIQHPVYAARMQEVAEAIFLAQLPTLGRLTGCRAHGPLGARGFGWAHSHPGGGTTTCSSTRPEPLEFGELDIVIRHTKASSPHLDGILYEVWALIGHFGAKLIYALYLHIARGGSIRVKCNEPVSVLVPKAPAGGLQIDSSAVAAHGGFRPISISNTLHKLFTKALKLPHVLMERLGARCADRTHISLAAGADVRRGPHRHRVQGTW